MQRISLDGQVAIVTGSGNGLGRTYALELARRGAAVVINDIDAKAADAVVAEIVSAGGQGAAVYESVASAEGGAEIVRAATDKLGTIDIIIHNAGTWRNAGMGDMTIDNVDPVLDVHVRGAFFLLQPAWQVLREKQYGRIILVSSNVGVFGRENGANYVAAKGALFGLTRAIALEGRNHGIVANAVMPIAQTSDDRRQMVGDYRVRVANALDSLHGRGLAEMVCPLVAFLASRECSVTGEAFSAGAGRFARVFAGVTEGWTSASPEPPPAEAVLEHLDEIRDRARYHVPEDAFDELRALTVSLRAAGAIPAQ